MLKFQDFLKMMDEELWNTTGPQDNPGNPGTKRKNATNYLNKKYGVAGGGGMGGFGFQAAGAKPMTAPPPKRMKKP